MDYLEILEQLEYIDEVTLLELLEITSEDIIERFSDRINENLDRIYKKLRD